MVVAIVQAEGAFVDCGTAKTTAGPACVARAGERPNGICATGVHVTVMRLQNALVNIIAARATASPA